MAINEIVPGPLLLAPVARNWGWILARGVAAIIFGILCFVAPVISLLALVVVYGVYAIVDGISAMVWGARSRWLWMGVVGAISVAGGLVALFWPGITALALLYIIAAWAIVRGAAEIAAAVYLRREIENEWMLAGGGALSILVGVLIMLFPGAGVLAVLWLIGLFAVVFGGLAVALALRLRGLDRNLRQQQEQAAVGVGRSDRTVDEHMR